MNFNLTELQIVLLAAGILLAANFIAAILHFLYRSLSEGPFREKIREVIYMLDKVADDMSNEQKRRLAVQQIGEVLGWRRILVPAALIGWIIDVEVGVIRRMQKAADTPNLHDEEREEFETSNTSGNPESRFGGQE